MQKALSEFTFRRSANDEADMHVTYDDGAVEVFSKVSFWKVWDAAGDDAPMVSLHSANTDVMALFWLNTDVRCIDFFPSE